MILSLLLFFLGYFSQTELFKKYKSLNFINGFFLASMTKELNFSYYASKYKQIFGSDSTILPVFSKFNKKNNLLFLRPIREGDIVSYFDDKKKGLIVASVNPTVIASEDGVVIFKGYRQGLGNFLVIRHSKGYETWYGFLKEVQIDKGAPVKKGEKIATMTKSYEKYKLFFALRKDKKFINPVGVVFFE